MSEDTALDPYAYYPGSKQVRKSLDDSEPPEATPVLWDERPVTKIVAGREVEFFTIGALAKALNKSVVTIRLWIRQGHLPAATYRLPEKNGVQGRRLYTRAQIEAVIEAAREADLIDQPRIDWLKHHDFAQTVRERWANI